ncbi:AraC family transcriptional regulator [Spongiactinospora sp. TRM90649]|uniref:AraC family transcriptional regulator n=1 Tax=Spongiactinospora sp. TRM90649 TaxID=3031114 RepID=UPI0023F682DA|nr:AraC family transcriptional regulator [Spongiactinospora sp. TRM90649]MDF5756224.1 AraC family transcriptional regulator [Spongiactinospora sp. TRM90649]
MDADPNTVTAISRRLRLPSGHGFPSHSHTTWSFGLAWTGSARLRSRGSWHTVRPAVATVLHPDEVHGGVTASGGAEYTAMSVAANLVAEIVGHTATPTFDDVLQSPVPVRRLAEALQGRSITGADEPAGSDREERRELALNALVRIFAGARLGRAAAPGRTLAVAVRRVLDAQYTQQISVRSMAEHFDVAIGSLIRSFRGHTGLTPYAYVVSRRIDLARRLLAADVPPADVARRAGFYDQAHLNRHFARLVGVSPAVYRRA